MVVRLQGKGCGEWESEGREKAEVEGGKAFDGCAPVFVELTILQYLQLPLSRDEHVESASHLMSSQGFLN